MPNTQDRGVALGLCALVAGLMAACAGSEPAAVMQLGSRNLKCPREDVRTELSRTTPMVREYLVGCDFMYTRIQCTSAACYPAEVEPPCIGDAPCFEEDPVTLRWVLKPRAQGVARADTSR